MESYHGDKSPENIPKIVNFDDQKVPVDMEHSIDNVY